MLNVNFDVEAFRDIIREELQEVVRGNKFQSLPPLLTRDELKELFHIGDTKAAELLGRKDFPVLREAGVLIPTHLLMQWIDANTEWVSSNTRYLKSIS